MSPAIPSVTVVMPVYNALPWLDAAIESMLTQTLGDFALAIYDDHSSDGSYERALEWAARDQRISVSRGTRRLGPSASSQAAAMLARSEFVARMDADDISHPERLAQQLAALQADPGAVLVGSTIEMIDGKGKVIRAATPGRIAGKAPPFAHPSIMYRRHAFDAAGGYRPGTEYFEDLDLFRRMAGQGRILVINRPLLQLRFAGQNARLTDDRMAVLRRVERQYGHGWSEADDAPDHRIAPLAFYSLAVLSILTLQRPHLVGMMLRHASFAKPLVAMAVLAMVTVAEVSPLLARGIGDALSWWRERRTAGRFVPGEVYRWDFPGVSATAFEPKAALQAA